MIVSGEGVSVRLVDYYRIMSNEEFGLLRQQLNELRKPEVVLDDVLSAKMAYFEFATPIGPEQQAPPTDPNAGAGPIRKRGGQTESDPTH